MLEMCVPYTDTSAYRRQHVSRVSLAPGKQQCLVLDKPGRRPIETQKNRIPTTCDVWQWLLSKKVAATVCPLHFDTKCEQSDCNKSLTTCHSTVYAAL